jgi:hypothetical protein
MRLPLMQRATSRASLPNGSKQGDQELCRTQLGISLDRVPV